MTVFDKRLIHLKRDSQARFTYNYCVPTVFRQIREMKISD